MTVWSAIVALWAFAIGGAIGAWLMHYTGRGNAAICTVVTHHRHLLLNLTEGMNQLMESQSQLAELQGEMATLNERIVALQAIIESADGASQELTDAVAAVVAQARAVDDAIPDAPVVHPIEPVDL